MSLNLCDASCLPVAARCLPVQGGHPSVNPMPRCYLSRLLEVGVCQVKCMVTNFAYVGKRLQVSKLGAHLGCEVPLER